MLENTVGKTWANTFLRVAVTLLVMRLKYGKKVQKLLNCMIVAFHIRSLKEKLHSFAEESFFFSQPELFLSKCGGENHLTLNSQGTE